MEESKKKELKWKQMPEGLYVVYFEGGGELPAELSGRFTSVVRAQQAIDKYKTLKGI